ncbi:MAG: hypothetical protein QXL67_02370 [Candidatus Bathyarchaeia archaeon]
MHSDVKISMREVLSYLASEIMIARRTQDRVRCEKLAVAFKVLSEEYERI